MFKAEQDLMDMEVRFAEAIGVPVNTELVALSGSDTHHTTNGEALLRQVAAPPPEIGMYRFFVFLNELRDLAPQAISKGVTSDF